MGRGKRQVKPPKGEQKRALRAARVEAASSGSPQAKRPRQATSLGSIADDVPVRTRQPREASKDVSALVEARINHFASDREARQDV